MKPDDIPQGVWDDACRRCENFEGEQSEHEIIGTVARAIMAEREACAIISTKEVGRDGLDDWARGYRSAAAEIASAIRSRP